MKYIRTKDGVYKLDSEKCFYAIRDTSVNNKHCYVSWFWDNWKEYYTTDGLNCMLFSYNSAQAFICDLMKENLNYENLVIEINEYYKDCKQSDTIEELCDEFVVMSGYSLRHYQFKTLRNATKHSKLYPFEVMYIYGAIWTDKGLIYVAKMNDKGELELLWHK